MQRFKLTLRNEVCAMNIVGYVVVCYDKVTSSIQTHAEHFPLDHQGMLCVYITLLHGAKQFSTAYAVLDNRWDHAGRAVYQSIFTQPTSRLPAT